MSQTWGRTDAAGTWLHPKPIWTVAAVLLAAAAVTLVAVYRYHVAWTPLQRAYAPTYLRAAVMATFDVTTTGRYRLLEVGTGAGSRLALEDEVEPAAGTGAEPVFRLTELAAEPGLAAWSGARPHIPTGRSTRSWGAGSTAIVPSQQSSAPPSGVGARCSSAV